MIDDQLVLRIERLREELSSLKEALRSSFPGANRRVQSHQLRKQAASLAERWLVEVAGVRATVAAIGDTIVAQRSVYFQRLLTYSEHNTARRKYDQAINLILKDFIKLIIVPLKAKRADGENLVPTPPASATSPLNLARGQTVFVGQSFIAGDKEINTAIERFFTALGMTVVSGEKPKADSVSKKVMERIDASAVFVGIFTRRDKLEGKKEWATSSWVVDEKAYALAKNKKLFILREEGINSIGGLHGDYEYIPFTRTKLSELLLKLIELCAPALH